MRALAAALPPRWSTLAYRDAPDGQTPQPLRLSRVVAAGPIRRLRHPAAPEWLIIEWPEGADGAERHWLSNLPAGTTPERLARLARLRWTIELDYRQLKGELGLDHYEGRSYAGCHHHTALVTCAHAFLTQERLDPKAPQPA